MAICRLNKIARTIILMKNQELVEKELYPHYLKTGFPKKQEKLCNQSDYIVS